MSIVAVKDQTPLPRQMAPRPDRRGRLSPRGSWWCYGSERLSHSRKAGNL